MTVVEAIFTVIVLISCGAGVGWFLVDLDKQYKKIEKEFEDEHNKNTNN